MNLILVDGTANAKASQLMGTLCKSASLLMQPHDIELLHDAYTRSVVAVDMSAATVWDPRKQWTDFEQEERNGIDPAGPQIEELQLKLG